MLTTVPTAEDPNPNFVNIGQLLSEKTTTRNEPERVKTLDFQSQAPQDVRPKTVKSDSRKPNIMDQLKSELATQD